MVSRWSAKAALMVAAKGVETRKRPRGGDVDDDFSGSSPRLGVRGGRFSGIQVHTEKKSGKCRKTR
jgi:hypothetical protein